MTSLQKITPAEIDTLVADVQYLRPAGTLTIAIVTCQNGIKITGESACLNPADFNVQIGEQIALANAKAKLWALEGYHRASAARMHAGATAPAVDDE